MSHKNLQCCCLQQGLRSTADRSGALLSRTLILNSSELFWATDTVLLLHVSPSCAEVDWPFFPWPSSFPLCMNDVVNELNPTPSQQSEQGLYSHGVILPSVWISGKCSDSQGDKFLSYVEGFPKETIPSTKCKSWWVEISKTLNATLWFN